MSRQLAESGGAMEGPDPSYADTVDDLARCLLQLHIWADTPSLRTLEQRTGKAAGRPLADGVLRSVRLGRSSLHDILHGRKFPKKAFLLTFVDACGIDLTTDRRWEEAWNRLAPRYAGDFAAQDADPRQQVEQIRVRAEQAEKENEQLRQQVEQIRARAEQAEKENEQLRQQVEQIRARAEQAEGENEQLRRQASSGTGPLQTSVVTGQMALTPQSGRKAPVRETPPARETPVRETLRRWDPERIGPYVVLGRLGSGSMGQVYLGRSPAGRLVAVKTIKVELAEDAGFAPGSRRRWRPRGR